MRDKFHFNPREDEWELKSKKGFVKRRWWRRERGVDHRKGMIGKEEEDEKKRNRKGKRSLFNTLGKQMSWKTKHRKVRSCRLRKPCQQWAHLAMEQKHTHKKLSVNWWTQSQKKYRNKDFIVDQNINVQAGTKYAETWTGGAHVSRGRSSLHSYSHTETRTLASMHSGQVYTDGFGGNLTQNIWLHWATLPALAGKRQAIWDQSRFLFFFFFFFASVACFAVQMNHSGNKIAWKILTLGNLQSDVGLAAGCTHFLYIAPSPRFSGGGGKHLD